MKQKKAQFVGSSTFWGMLTNFRVLLLEGRYGGGKTSSAFLMAARLKAEGYVDRVVSNIPCSFTDPVETLADRSALVIDESWIYIEGRKDALDYAGFVRKFEHYLLLPSVFDINARLSAFSCWRIFNAYSLGLPLWFYRWNLRKRVKENGIFAILHPQAIFGHYPTKFVAGTDGGISDQLAKISKNAGFVGTRREQKRQMVEVSINDSEATGFDDDNLSELAEQIEDASRRVDLGVEDLEALAKDFKRSVKRFGH